MKLIRLTDEVDAWGETWPAGTVLPVCRERDEAWEVLFELDSGPIVGTVTRRQAEEIGQ